MPKTRPLTKSAANAATGRAPARTPHHNPAAKPLDHRERRFVDEFLIDLNPRRAALAAGYSRTMAASKAYTWVSNGKTKPHVYAAIQRAQQLRAARTGVTADRVVEEIAKIAFASMRSFVRIDRDGQPQIDLSAAGPDALDALAEVITETVVDGQSADSTGATVPTVRRTRIRLHDKLRALHELAEHTGVFRERDERQGNAVARLIAELQAAGQMGSMRLRHDPAAHDGADDTA